LLAEGFDLRGHRDCVATSCPGERAYLALDRIRARMVTPSLVPSHDEMEDEVPYLMIRDDRNGAIFACFPSGKVRHIGGAEWKYYTDCNVKMVSAADDAEADRLAAHGI